MTTIHTAPWQVAWILVECGIIARTAWRERKLVVEQQFDTRPSETMDFFTKLDGELDERIIALLGKRWIVNRFLTKEGSKTPERNQVGGSRAVIDSLDGSSNFATYRPDFGISIAIELNGQPYTAGIITPIRGELVMAFRGQRCVFFPFYGLSDFELKSLVEEGFGAAEKVTTQRFALPQKKVMASPLKTSRIYVHTGKRRNFELAPDDPWNTIYAKLANPGCSFCCTVALVEVALGKLDGAAIGFQNYWDFAAGKLLVEEAGGFVSVWDRNWSRKLTPVEFAQAHAAKTADGDEWLAHVLAAGSRELLDALEAHFIRM